MVRAKFRCEKVTTDAEGLSNLELRAVYQGSPENEMYWKYTPGGYIQLSTVNQAAAAQFKEGAEYYVDFTPAQ